MVDNRFDPRCMCGHLMSDHIYDEGSCRPGSICECRKFRPNNQPRRQHMTKRTYDVTLTLRVDASRDNPPNEWNWRPLVHPGRSHNLRNVHVDRVEEVAYGTHHAAEFLASLIGEDGMLNDQMAEVFGWLLEDGAAWGRATELARELGYSEASP